jgi:hypothetical protein
MKTFHQAQILVTELKSVLSEKLKISAFFVLKLFEHLCCRPVTFRPVTVHSVWVPSTHIFRRGNNSTQKNFDFVTVNPKAVGLFSQKPFSLTHKKWA